MLKKNVGNFVNLRRGNTDLMLSCLNDWANGRTVVEVESALRHWLGRVEEADESGTPFCVAMFRQVWIERPQGDQNGRVAAGLRPGPWRCD